MPKLSSETYQQYRDRVLNPISNSFCSAKFYNSTIWLGSGSTASCHHPPAHKIPLEELKASYKALHNTSYKKLVRAQMLNGERPKECEYCWKVEDLGEQFVSDRVYKSIIYSDEDQKLANSATHDYDLKTLEIAFDSICNFACSYCNPSFSTTWMADVKKNGPYQNLVSDGGGAFQQDGSWAQPYGLKNENNPYVKAFFDWWDADLQHTLSELRITGGEATMSQDFWDFIESKWPEDCNVRLAVNSNLGSNKNLIQRLCDLTHKIKSFDLYTSNESFGFNAEYIRDGLKWDTWFDNLVTMLSNGNLRGSHVMLTINSLCLFSLTTFMDLMLGLRKKFGNRACFMSFNILRFPSFMSVVTLPIELRLKKASELEAWLEKTWVEAEAQSNYSMHQMERDGVIRLISYLREVDEGHSHTSSIQSRERDFKSFFTQYDARRGKDFKWNFPELATWYDSIPETKLIPIKLVKNKLISGDATSQVIPIQEELKERAEKEGWVLVKQSSNPGAQDYVESAI